MLNEIKDWLQLTEGKGGIARRDHMEWLVGEVERLGLLAESGKTERQGLFDSIKRQADMILSLRQNPFVTWKEREKFVGFLAGMEEKTPGGFPPASWRPVTDADYLEPNPLIDEALGYMTIEGDQAVQFAGMGHFFAGGKVPDHFTTRQGDPAAQAHDGDWLQPTVNPFGHGCCDCGLYHSVEWRLVDEEGNEVFPVEIGDTLQLKFTRDDEETERLREHRAAAPTDKVRLAAIKAIERLEDLSERGGGPAFIKAKDMLGPELFMILRGLQEAV